MSSELVALEIVLLSLPNELLLTILLNVTTPRDLCNLGSTCWTMRHLVEYHWTELTVIRVEMTERLMAHLYRLKLNGTRFTSKDKFRMALQHMLRLMGPEANLRTIELHSWIYDDSQGDQLYHDHLLVDIIRSGRATRLTELSLHGPFISSRIAPRLIRDNNEYLHVLCIEYLNGHMGDERLIGAMVGQCQHLWTLVYDRGETETEYLPWRSHIRRLLINKTELTKLELNLGSTHGQPQAPAVPQRRASNRLLRMLTRGQTNPIPLTTLRLEANYGPTSGPIGMTFEKLRHNFMPAQNHTSIFFNITELELSSNLPTYENLLQLLDIFPSLKVYRIKDRPRLDIGNLYTAQVAQAYLDKYQHSGTPKHLQVIYLWDTSAGQVDTEAFIIRQTLENLLHFPWPYYETHHRTRTGRLRRYDVAFKRDNVTVELCTSVDNSMDFGLRPDL